MDLGIGLVVGFVVGFIFGRLMLKSRQRVKIHITSELLEAYIDHRNRNNGVRSCV